MAGQPNKVQPNKRVQPNKVDYQIVSSVILTSNDLIVLSIPNLHGDREYNIDEEHPYYIAEIDK